MNNKQLKMKNRVYATILIFHFQSLILKNET